MWISTKTTIGFEVPKEYELMCKFRAEHPDFKEEPTSNMIWFTKELAVESHGRRKVLFGSGIEVSDTSNLKGETDE